MKYLLVIFLFIGFSAEDHDVAIANFDIFQKENSIQLEIVMDKESVEKSLKECLKGEVDFNRKNISQYLNEKSTWEFNDDVVELEVINISKDELFYHIKCQFKNDLDVIKKIKIRNTCLLEKTKNHSNIMNFHLNNKMRTFRMHKGRKKILVEY